MKGFIALLVWTMIGLRWCAVQGVAQSTYQSYTFSTLAGLPGHSGGSADGTGSAARFNAPTGVAVDSAGNVYVADDYNFTIRKIEAGGVVTTVAGLAGSAGSADGTGSAARFGWEFVTDYSSSINGPVGLAVDSAGNVYVVDSGNDTIRKIRPGGVVTTVAGLAESPGSADGTGAAARFAGPNAVAVDSADNLYVVDAGGTTIRKITPGAVVMTVAGSAGITGSADGTGSAARFGQVFFDNPRGSNISPSGVAVDSAGNVYIADRGNFTIRKIEPGGAVTTLAGLARIGGSADGTGSAARFSLPSGVAVDGAGNVFVADSGNDTIRKIGPGGVVTTVAGLVGSLGSADGTGSAVRFNHPTGVTVDSAGNLYVADAGNNTIRKGVPTGVPPCAPAITYQPQNQTVAVGGSVTFAVAASSAAPINYQWTFNTAALPGATSPTLVLTNVQAAQAGAYAAVVTNLSGAVTSQVATLTVGPAGAREVLTFSTLAGPAGSRASVDGRGSAARFDDPVGLAVDTAGNMYVSDSENFTIRKIGPGGVVTTLAGLAGSFGSADGTGSVARFSAAQGVAVDSVGNLYVADTGNQTVRKIGPGGVVTTVAGLAGNAGSADGTSSAARFDYPEGLAVDAAGNVYVADQLNSTIRKIAPGGVVTTVAGLAGISGSADGPGHAARFTAPGGVAVDSAGNVYVADSWNDTIRKIRPGGLVTTLAGLAGGLGSIDGTGSAARFAQPEGVAVDAAGNVYVADSWNNTIRTIGAGGVVTTVAGLAGGPGTNDGTGSLARFYFPEGVAVDSAGSVYVADSFNSTIRKIGPGGVVTTLAGLAGSDGGADGTGSAARFVGPGGVAVDAAGNVYVADTDNHTIRKIVAGGVVTTVAGLAGSSGSADGTGSVARFYLPVSVAVDTAGNVYVADADNEAIRKIEPGGGAAQLFPRR